MVPTRVSAALLAALILLGVSRPLQAQDQDEGMRSLLDVVERVAQSGDAAAYLGLLADGADRGRAGDFAANELIPGATRVVVKERDRLPLAGMPPGDGYRLWVDAFTELGSRSRIATWRVDVRRVREPGGGREWAIADQERVTSVESIYRLALNPLKQFVARNLKLASEDLDVTLADGSVFVSDIDQGVTGLVLIGHGTFNFHPAPEMERGQVKIFCGREALETSFYAAYIRLHPSDFEGAFDAAQLQAASVDPRELRRAQDVFRDESQKSFAIDLGDLSREAWTLLPSPGDFLAELRTKKYDTLTYAKSSTEAEDITLFDRKRHHNIALYASSRRLAQRGRFYNEDDLVDYDVLHYDVDVSASPDRMWIDGRAVVRLTVKAPILGAITMRLADPLIVSSIVSYEYGRLFHVRVKNQNTMVINLPTPVMRDTQITLTIAYAGRLEPQTPDRETIALLQNRGDADDIISALQAEPSYLYSNRSYWYPQAAVTDYATATIRINVPATLECVASGELEPGFPLLLAGTKDAKEPKDAKDLATRRKVYQFSASQPLRYLAFIISRFMRAETVTLALPAAERESPIVLTGISYHSLSLSVETNPRQVQRGHDLVDRAGDVAAFYTSLIGDSPYSSFTIALVENDLPGGHSPGYFAALNQPLPSSNLSWRNDPAAFNGFADFFLAHELAHQWWGQAVAGRNYHEQWLSEGFAQYFAALYAQHQRGDELFASVLKQLRRWGMDESKQGPVYLGYRLGHIRNESRVFRALVYNKGAAVLHMLRRLMGDDKFFAGLRGYYARSRFRKVGTEDLRAAMEAESGRSLERFFERWIYGTQVAKLKFSYRVEGAEIVLHADQIGDVFDLPLTVTLHYADKRTVDVVMSVTERSVDARVPLTGTLRGVDIKEDGTLAEISKS
ncbi:MAG: hypothetical protein HY048_05380 [Acidobacteria bacterium]|nr:hypothetical protein [Acidobacteriota bacterium]